MGVGVQILTDPSVLVSLPKGSDGRPADVGLFGYGGIRGNTVVVDTTIAPILGVSSSDPTTALWAAERHKIQKYDEGVRNAAGMLRFVPFAVSEFDLLAPHAEAFFVELAKASHTHTGQKIGQHRLGTMNRLALREAPAASCRVTSRPLAANRRAAPVAVASSGAERDQARAARAAVVGGMAALLVGQPALAAVPRSELTNKEVDSASSPYIQELLKRTEENKDRRYKERLDDYYCRNFKDYFDVEVGGRGVAQMRGVQKKNSDAIVKWLEEHPTCKMNAVK
eukprot:jgi/Tetstr1/455499/TSEL_042327.t1